jgi:hypothetical protein
MKKNIFLLPTDQLSRLHKAFDKTFILSKIPALKNELYKSVPQHIYITSDEEIKEENYFINKNGQISKCVKALEEWLKFNKSDIRKIILTTDQDLIADGVQSIDDEFLEWFVENPSIEWIEVSKNHFYEESDYQHYKIILPTEEPKISCPKCRTTDFDNCHSIQCPMREEPKQFSMNADLYENHGIVLPELPKQETLEEASIRLVPNRILKTPFGTPYEITPTRERNTFKKGAKWQAERMYSEEEVRKILLDITLINPAHLTLLESGYGQFPDSYKLTEKGINYIIEQFKKK